MFFISPNAPRDIHARVVTGRVVRDPSNVSLDTMRPVVLFIPCHCHDTARYDPSDFKFAFGTTRRAVS